MRNRSISTNERSSSKLAIEQNASLYFGLKTCHTYIQTFVREDDRKQPTLRSKFSCNEWKEMTLKSNQNDILKKAREKREKINVQSANPSFNAYICTFNASMYKANNQVFLSAIQHFTQSLEFSFNMFQCTFGSDSTRFSNFNSVL